MSEGFDGQSGWHTITDSLTPIHDRLAAESLRESVFGTGDEPRRVWPRWAIALTMLLALALAVGPFIWALS